MSTSANKPRGSGSVSWRRRLAEMLELEPANVPVSFKPDGSVLLHLGSKPIDLGRLPEGVVDQEFHERPKGDRSVARSFGFSLRRLGGELHEIPSKRELGGAGLTLLLATLLLSHVRQHIRGGSS